MILDNPIFVRETRTSTRDPKTVLLILGFFVILGGVVLFLWPKSGVFSLVADTSMEIFAIFFMSNLALVILLVPALTSPSITSERENNSFDLLYTSLLTPGEILRGKLFAAITMIVTVVLVSMPISAICALSGGIGPSLLLRAYAVILMSALTYGILGLAISALCTSTFTALIMTYVVVAALAGATWLPYYLLGQLTMLSKVWALLRALSPFDALFALLFPSRYALTELSRPGSPFLPFWLHMLGMSVLLVLVLIIFCRYVLSPPRPGAIYRWLAGALILIALIALVGEYNLYSIAGNRRNVPEWASRRNIILISLAVDALLFLLIRGMVLMSFSEGEKYQGFYTDFRTAVKRKLTWPFYLIDPLRRKSPIGRWRNPVFVAEMRSKLFGRPKFLIRGTFACIIASMLLLLMVCFQYASFLSPDIVRLVAVVFQLGIVAIIAPAISSGAITDEMTSRTFLMLRMTPLSALAVVTGKLKSAFLYVSIFLVSSLPVLLALVYLDVTREDLSLASFWRVGVWIAIMVLTTIAFIAGGFCASAFSRTTSTATAVSYCFAGLVCIVTFAAMIPDAFSDRMQQVLLMLNPMVAALRVTSDELFSHVSPDVWVDNLIFLSSISLAFIIASAARVYYTFTRQV